MFRGVCKFVISSLLGYNNNIWPELTWNAQICNLRRQFGSLHNVRLIDGWFVLRLLFAQALSELELASENKECVPGKPCRKFQL